MPRVTYRTRLQALKSNDNISDYDLNIVESLLTYYESKKCLTTGRAAWVQRLEERYDPAKLLEAKAANASLIDRLNTLKELVEPNSWSSGFVESLQKQALREAYMSPNQLTVLRKIESENTPEIKIIREQFAVDYRANKNGMRDDLIVLAHYYERGTDYFHNVSDTVLSDKNFVPSPEQYNKITKNKYAQRVLAAHHAEPKYSNGTWVQLRSTSPSRGRSWESKRLLVIKADAEPIVTSCKGAKRYHVLPVGAGRVEVVEERHIMKARKLTKHEVEERRNRRENR